MNLKMTPRLSSNALKLIALVSMTVDHIGLILFPQYRVLRIIGRIAFPIFAYMIAEGCRYTSNRIRYFLTIFLLTLLLTASESFCSHSPDSLNISLAPYCALNRK